MKNYSEYFDDKEIYTKYEVVGLPSGQIIYLTKQQLTYFTSRFIIEYKRDHHVLKKPPENGVFSPDNVEKIHLNKFCFDDYKLDDIIDTLNTFTWDF